MIIQTYDLFRNDDISVTSNICILQKVNNLFKKYNQIHTCAVLMENLWDNKEVWYFLIHEPNVEIGLHGWGHRDYGKLPYKEIVEDIRKSLDYWNVRAKKSFGIDKFKKIDTLFPPWNSVSPDLERACKDCGLKLDARVGGTVYNFHYWACIDEGKLKGLEINLERGINPMIKE